MDNKSWVIGFLEANSSFAVNIQLKSTKYKRTVVFKPYIVIANIDEQQTEYIKRFINLEYANIRKKTKKKIYHNDYFSLNIQNRKDIDRVIALIKETGFKSQTKQSSFDTFIECYDLIKDAGDYHHDWLDGFSHIIEKKIEINENRANIDKNRLSAKEWEKKIKNHLE